jgi:hypothetical protein
MRILEDNIKMLVLVRNCMAGCGQGQVTGRCEHGSETYFFHKMRGFSLPSEELLATPARFRLMELFN